MKIATYDLEFLFDEGTYAHSGKEWTYAREVVQKRVDYYAKVFSEIDADILFLQEVASEVILRRILEKANGGYSYFLVAPAENGIGNAVIYKKKGDCVYESIPARTSLPVFVSGDGDVAGCHI